jgi:hypothetical protein
MKNFLHKLKVFFFGDEIKVGQVWQHDYYVKNPFSNEGMITILAIRKNWARFQYNSDDTYTEASFREIRYFYTLVEDVE